MSKITATTPFTGYARDLQQTEKKKLHNVLKKGDVYFNSGDLMTIDDDNFIYFQDRVGDTFRWVQLLPQPPDLRISNLNANSRYTVTVFGFFVAVKRWKGENVATTEVADILAVLDGIEEANVYGVEVPGNFF